MSVVFGAASIAGLYRPVSRDDALATLEEAWNQGIRAFDTAPHYGVGLSETLLGEFLQDKPRESYTLSTKVGRLLYDDPGAQDGTDGFFGAPKRSRIRDYSRDGVLRSLEDSLQRLGLDRVDTLFVHDPEDHMDAALDQAVPALAQLRDHGVISSYGVGTNYAQIASRFVAETSADRIMVAGRYSLLDRRADATLLALCAQRQVRVQVAGVLNSGLLAEPGPGAPFNYEPAPQWLIEVAQQMGQACARYDIALPAAALQFPTRHPAVEAIVIGPGRVATVRDTFAQLAVSIPDGLWDELEALLPDQDRLPS
ncbi:aldo/keto reductase [Pseudactinotalea sp. Z1748]|uniref:aldo/keto reductase n=1 Tax=Pseudactinotalea sp. Z1748 TaxID=3413027 RepID=UPI003C7DADF3